MASTKRSAPRGTKKEQSDEAIKQTMLMVQLRTMGKKNAEIASMFGVSEVTVSRKIGEFYKKIQESLGPDYEDGVKEIVEEHKHKSVSVATVKNGTLDKLTPTENILANLDMENATKMAYTAGIVPAQAFSLIIRGLDNESGRSRDERGGDFIKGFSLIGSLLFGAKEGFDALNERKQKTVINNGDEIR